MKKYVSLAIVALMASSGLAMAQGFGGGGGRGGGAIEIEQDDVRAGRSGRNRDRGGAVEIEEDDNRRGRGGGREGIAVGEPRPDRGGRDWDRGRDYGQGRDWDRGRDFRRSRETVILRTLPPRYRFVEERGRRCRVVITQRQRPNGTIVSTERREC